MFKKLQRELNRLPRGGALRIPVEADERGYLDKECPAEQCKYQFKVKEQDWTTISDANAAYCPRCGTVLKRTHGGPQNK